MTLKIEVASNAAASAWTDITDKVRTEGMRLGGTANRIEIDTASGFDLDDDAGDVSLPIRRVIRVTEDATTPDTILFRGRLINNTSARGSNLTGDARRLDVSLIDNNAHFGGITIDRASRPAETDVERMTWLLETYLQGIRASTDLADTWLLSDAPVDLPANVYEGVPPADVISDVLTQTGKQCFATIHDELFYAPNTTTAYAASLSITDVDPDGETSFAPDNQASGDEDGSEYFSRVHVFYKDRQHAGVISANEPDNDVWSTSISDESITTEAQATARGNLFLSELDHAELRYRTAIVLRDDQVDLIEKGQTVSFRSAACGVLTPTTLRVARLQWEILAPGVYKAHLELGYPEKLAARKGPGGLGSGGPGGPGGGGGGNGGGKDCSCGPAPFEGCPDVSFLVSAHAGDLSCVIPSSSMNGLACFSDDTDGGGNVILYDGCQYRVQYLVDHGPLSNRLTATMVGTGGSPTLGGVNMGSLREGTNINAAEAFFSTPAGSSFGTYEVWLQDVTYMGRDPTGASVSAVVTYVSGPDPRFEDLLSDECTALPAHGQPVVHEGIAGDTSGTTFTTNHPYLPGSLLVFINGVRVIATESSPGSGTFTLPFDTTGLVVVVSYLGTGAGAGTGANNPTSAAAHVLIPPILLGTGYDGSGDNVLHDDGTWRPVTLGDGPEAPDRASAIGASAVRLSAEDPEVVQSAYAVEAIAQIVSVVLPAAVTPGNLLVAWHSVRSAPTPLTPDGWTAHPDGTVSDGASNAGMFYRVAQLGDTDTFDFESSSGAVHRAAVVEFAGAGALDTSDEDTGAGVDLAISQAISDAAVMFAGFIYGTNTVSTGTPLADSVELDDGDVGDAGGFEPQTWFGYRLEAAAGTYATGATASTSAGWGGQGLAFLTSGAAWIVPAPLAVDGDDGTYETVDGPDVLRIGLGSPYLIVRARLRIACETAGSRTYTIKGANQADFSDEVTLASATFTATGSFTAQDVAFLWASSTAYEFYELSGDDETRRIHSWELFEANDGQIIVTDPSSVTDVELQEALDNVFTAIGVHPADTSDAHDASAISIADAGGYFTATDVEGVLQEIGPGQTGRWEVVVDGTAPPVAVTTEAEDDWLYALVT